MKQSFQLQTVTVVFAFYKREKVFKTFQGMKQSFQLQSVTVIFAYHMQLFIIVMKVFKTLKQSFQIQTVSVVFVIAVHRFIQWLIKNGFFSTRVGFWEKARNRLLHCFCVFFPSCRFPSVVGASFGSSHNANVCFMLLLTLQRERDIKCLSQSHRCTTRNSFIS